MSPPPKREVMGSLPRTRPHRRSDKRQATRPAAGPDNGSPARDESPAATTGGTAKPAGQRGATKPKAGAAKGKSGAAKPRSAAAKPGSAAAKGTGTAPKAKATATSRARPASPTPASPSPAPAADKAPGTLETAVQAVAELTEIGLHAGARALRGALSRLSR